ncbi:MAG: pilus assembly protein N-terminal domain-containing protein [Parvibaculaceae bacterium]
MQTSPLRKIRAAAGALTLAGSLMASSAWAADINVEVNQTRLHKLAQSASTIIVGNPSIADVSVTNTDTLVVLGRSYGKTNLIVLNEAGGQIASLDVNVVAARDTALILNRGAGQYSYNCTPDCVRVVDPTDVTEAADALLSSTQGVTGFGDKTAESSNGR